MRLPSDPSPAGNTASAKGPVLGALAFLAAVPLLLFFPALFQGRLIFGEDTLALGIPFHAEVARSLAAHRWPLWLPGVLGGMPGIASCNLLFAYPTDFLGSLARLPLPLLLGIDAALHTALAGVGLFLFLRRLDRSVPAALLGGCCFALSGSEISQVHGGFYNFVEGAAWIPWAFWAAHAAARRRSPLAWGLCGAAFALQVLAGASQLCAYTLAAVFCYALAEAGRGPTPGGRPGTARARLAVPAGFGLALGLAFFLAAPQLWPTLRYLPLAARHGYTHAEFNAGSLRPSDALGWAVAGWPTRYAGTLFTCYTSEYFGLLPWALGCAALTALWRDDARTRWMAALALAAFTLAQGRWTPFYALFRALPVLAGFRLWSRTLFLLTFAVCVLAAQGWDALRDPRTGPKALRGGLAFLALALAAAALAWRLAPGLDRAGAGPDGAPLSASGIRAAAFGAAGLCAVLGALLWFWSRRPRAAAALALALAFHAADQGRVLARFITFIAPENAVPLPRFRPAPPPPPGPEPWRVYDASAAQPNRTLLPGYENVQGYESVPLLEFQKTGEALAARPRDWLNLMNVRYVFVQAQGGDTVTVYENKGAFPRAWLVGKSRTVPDADAAYRLLADPAFRPRDTVAVQSGRRLAGTPPRGRVVWRSRGPQDFSLTASTDRASALVLSQFWYPAWKARVDGRDAPLLKADGGLQALFLGPGTHRVDFRFDPGLFDAALAAALAALAALGALGLLEAFGRAGP